MKSIKDILYESLLDDIDDQVENDLNEFLVLYNASDEQNYEHILKTLLDSYKKINPIKFLNVGFDLKLKKNVLYVAYYPSSSSSYNDGSIYIGTRNAKSKIVSMRWSSSQNKAVAFMHNSSITAIYSLKGVEWYEIPSDRLKDFEEFKKHIKK